MNRKPPTMTERADLIANQGLYGNYQKREKQLRALVLRQLRAAVRAERKACERLCRELDRECEADAKIERKRGRRRIAERCEANAFVAGVLADRIKRRPKP